MRIRGTRLQGQLQSRKRVSLGRALMLKSPESVSGDRRPRCSQGLSCAFSVTLLGEVWQRGHEPHLQDGTCVQRLSFRRQRAPCLVMGPLLQSKRGRDWEANPLTDKRQTSLIHKSTHSVCPAQTHLEASGETGVASHHSRRCISGPGAQPQQPVSPERPLQLL